jgi:hypothetical protein
VTSTFFPASPSGRNADDEGNESWRSKHAYCVGTSQMPTATRVAGFWTWKNFGRSVKAGQKGIRILAPIVGVRRKKDAEANKHITKQNERVLLGFRNAFVFDRLSRDLCPAPARLVSRTTPVYGATATESNQVVWQNPAFYPVD